MYFDYINFYITLVNVYEKVVEFTTRLKTPSVKYSDGHYYIDYICLNRKFTQLTELKNNINPIIYACFDYEGKEILDCTKLSRQLEGPCGDFHGNKRITPKVIINIFYPDIKYPIEQLHLFIMRTQDASPISLSADALLPQSDDHLPHHF